MPFVAGEYLFDAANSLLQKAIQLGGEQDKQFERLKSALAPSDQETSAGPFLRDLADRYMAHIQRGLVAPATLQAYSSYLEGFLKIIGEDRPARSITKQDLTAFRDKLLKSPVNWKRRKKDPRPGETIKTVSPVPVSNSRAYVKGFFQWIIDEGLVDAMLNPVQGIKAPFARAQKRRPFTRQEVESAHGRGDGDDLLELDLFEQFDPFCS